MGCSQCEKSADVGKRQYTLLDASDTQLCDISSQGRCQPHDPAWDEYLRVPLGQEMLTSAKGRGQACTDLGATGRSVLASASSR